MTQGGDDGELVTCKVRPRAFGDESLMQQTCIVPLNVCKICPIFDRLSASTGSSPSQFHPCKHDRTATNHDSKEHADEK